MKKKIKQMCCILALLSVFGFGAGITALTVSADNAITVSPETSVNATQQANESKKLVAALESDVYWINGIPYIDIVKEETAKGARSVSETVAVIPDLIVDENGYIEHVSSISGEVEIPEETEDGTTIVGIKGKAFNKSKITKVIIPATIIDIESNAFYMCISLEQLEWKTPLSDETEMGLTIQVNAFFRCTKLVDIVLPKRLTSLDVLAFSKYSSLKNIYIEEGCAKYRNGTGGYAGVVYTTDQEINSVETSYIWPEGKQK